MRRLAAALLLLTLLGGFAPAEAGEHRARRQMLVLTNEDRVARGRQELELSVRVSRYARRHSVAMAEAGEIFHSADLGRALRGQDWSIAGENVGVGSSLEELEEAFMNSKPHRRNILRRAFGHAGIGVVRTDGRLWVTVVLYG